MQDSEPQTTRTTQEWANEIIDTWCEGVKDGFEPFSAICGIIEAIKQEAMNAKY